jgi:hypothetical protein
MGTNAQAIGHLYRSALRAYDYGRPISGTTPILHPSTTLKYVVRNAKEYAARASLYASTIAAMRASTADPEPD